MSCRNPTENMSLGFPAYERRLVVTQWPVTKAAAYKHCCMEHEGGKGILDGVGGMLETQGS